MSSLVQRHQHTFRKASAVALPRSGSRKSDGNVTALAAAGLVRTTALGYGPATMRQASWVGFLFVVLVSGGCGEDRVGGVASNDSTLVGGPCFDRVNCDERLCQDFPSEDFPGGMCTLSCGTDNDCPSASACAGLLSGWVCLLVCEADVDCREQWSCQEVRRPGPLDADTGSFRACLGAM